MRQKELRIALVCYGGISLAIYMHGVTKELWHLARASRNFHAGEGPETAHSSPDETVQAVYLDLLRHIETAHDLRLRVLPDILAGASAGGLNALYLAQVVHSGQSLEPLTKLWLERADVDVLLDPDARLPTSVVKYWAVPVVRYLLTRPGNVVSASVAPETRAEVRAKLSRLVRSRWFEAPFGGLVFSRLLAEALDTLARGHTGLPLLPAGHPIDLFVTATDFRGHAEALRLHSPPQVLESEHRVSIGFRGLAPAKGGLPLAPVPEMVFAARATSSFPGAFPPLRASEIDMLMEERGEIWSGREDFLACILPRHSAGGKADQVALIDGSVLVNAPFAEAMSVLRDRPAHREVDRRFVYIDPSPTQFASLRSAGIPPVSGDDESPPPGFLHVIFGSLSSIPREQPIRDNLDALARKSREMERLNTIVASLRSEVEQAVESLFGHVLFLDHPTPKRLADWRQKAQLAAADRAAYAYHAYAGLKFSGVLDGLAHIMAQAAPRLDEAAVRERLATHLVGGEHTHLAGAKGGASTQVIAFLREHDLAYRIRRLRLLARRLTDDWEPEGSCEEVAREAARDAVYHALSLYFDRDGLAALGADFPSVAGRVMNDPGAVLARIAQRRQLEMTDLLADARLAGAMAAMPPRLRRFTLLTYLGFPFYDVSTLPLLRDEGLSEFDPVKVDRISPDDCNSIRKGGAAACLRGVEFYNFGAFFSRAYRENDYLWGRLHGAERMIELVASTLPANATLSPEDLRGFKRRAFLAILAEEGPRLLADPALVPGLVAEVRHAFQAAY